MTRSKATRRQAPSAQSGRRNDATLDIPLSEQIRLAESTGLFPPGALDGTATMASSSSSTAKGTIRDDGKGIKVEEFTVGSDGHPQRVRAEDRTEGNSSHHDQQTSEDDDVEYEEEDYESQTSLDQEYHYDRRRHGLDGEQEDEAPPTPVIPPSWVPLDRLSNEFIHTPTGISSKSDISQPATMDPADEWFVTIMYCIPLASLYLLFDILSHQSYNNEPGVKYYIGRLVTAIPTIALLVVLTNRYQNYVFTSLILMLASFGSGCRLFWLLNTAGYRLVMSQAAPVITLWILSVVQLSFGKLMISLLGVAWWHWRQGFEFTLGISS